MEFENWMRGYSGLRMAGVLICLLAMLAVGMYFGLFLPGSGGVRGVVFFWALHVPVLVSSLVALVKLGNRHRVAHVHAVVLAVIYMALLVPFWRVAPGEAAKDAQGGLVFVFGPLCVQLVAVALLVVFALVYFVCGRVAGRRG